MILDEVRNAKAQGNTIIPSTAKTITTKAAIAAVFCKAIPFPQHRV
jgi:hypothetical protein